MQNVVCGIGNGSLVLRSALKHDGWIPERLDRNISPATEKCENVIWRSNVSLERDFNPSISWLAGECRSSS